jgi:hypothetical protein
LPKREHEPTDTFKPTLSNIEITLTSTPEITLTVTVDKDNPTVTPTNLANMPRTIPPEASLDQQCVEIRDQLPQPGQYSGTLVLKGFISLASEERHDQLLNLDTLAAPVSLDDVEFAYSETISPDREWLAYEIPSQKKLIVKTIASSSSSHTIAWEENWEWFLGWLDNHHLLIYLGDSTYLVLDPFTAERILLQTDFPDKESPLGAGPDYWGFVKFNPALTRAVYLTNNSHIALRDLQANQIVTLLKSENNPYGREPVWSPKGDQFVIALQHYDQSADLLTEDLYLVENEGKTAKITNLSAFYTHLLQVDHYAWYPDSSRIAFWIRNDWQGYTFEDHLALLDLKTMRVTNLCISSEMTGLEPIWSPNGEQVIVNTYYNDRRVVLLIDIPEKQAFIIAGDYKPVGWMK